MAKGKGYRRLSSRKLVVKPSYGIDSPGVVRGFLIAGAAAFAAGLLIPVFRLGGLKVFLLSPTLLGLGFLSLGLALSMVAYSLRGKFNLRDRMIRAVKWRGNETVLDVGTGLGLIAIAAAKRLKTGTVTAFDGWNPSHLSGNSLERAQRNVEMEGVQDCVDLRNGDARDIGFVDNSFDVVYSLVCLHRIGEAEEREAACREIARVLKPGGVAIIADYAYSSDYARTLREAGLEVRGPTSQLLHAYAPLSMVTAIKR